MGEIMLIKEEKHWWLKYKCTDCIFGDTDCPYKEKGDSPACSLILEKGEINKKGVTTEGLAGVTLKLSGSC